MKESRLWCSQVCRKLLGVRESLQSGTQAPRELAWTCVHWALLAFHLHLFHPSPNDFLDLPLTSRRHSFSYRKPREQVDFIFSPPITLPLPRLVSTPFTLLHPTHRPATSLRHGSSFHHSAGSVCAASPLLARCRGSLQLARPVDPRSCAPLQAVLGSDSGPGRQRRLEVPA